MKLHEVEGTCPICGKKSHVILTESEFDAYIDYLCGNEPIQKMLPRTEADVREYLRTEDPEQRYCSECMSKLFGNAPSGRILPEYIGLLDIFEDEEFKSLDVYNKFEEKMIQTLQDKGLTPKKFKRLGSDLVRQLNSAA